MTLFDQNILVIFSSPAVKKKCTFLPKPNALFKSKVPAVRTAGIEKSTATYLLYLEGPYNWLIDFLTCEQ